MRLLHLIILFVVNDPRYVLFPGVKGRPIWSNIYLVYLIEQAGLGWPEMYYTSPPIGQIEHLACLCLALIIFSRIGSQCILDDHVIGAENLIATRPVVRHLAALTLLGNL